MMEASATSGFGTSAVSSTATRSALKAILVGGVIAGIVDMLQACIQEGWDIPLYVAAGLLGRGATHGGAGTYILGLLLHFFIACSAATVFYLVSRKLTFLMDHPLVCGLFFGAAVEDFMRFVVLPLSAYHSHGPYSYHDLVDGLAMHMIFVGLPIAYSVRRWGKTETKGTREQGTVNREQ